MFYKNYRFYILFIFLSSLLFIYIINFYYKIYNRGLVNEDIPIMIKYFFSWSFTYGLSIITSLLIYIDFYIFKNNKILLLGIFEAIFSNIVILSRGFFLLIFAYLRGFLYLENFKNKRFSILSISKSFLLLVFFLFLSFYIVSQLRNINFVKNEFYKPKTIISTITEFRSISVNRWVGIDALLSVSQSENINFEFFKSSLSEKKKVS